MWLYKITNKKNGKAYVGATIQSIVRRFNAHCHNAKPGGRSTLLAQAMREFGISAFTIEVLGETQNPEELIQMEIAAIREHHTLAPDGYNRTIGGEMVRRPRRGFHLSNEHREKIAAAHRGVKETPEFCRIVSEAKRGSHHAPISAKSRRKIAKSLMGHSVSQETRNKIAETLRKYNAARLEKENPRSENSIP